MIPCPYCMASEELQVQAGKNPSGSQRCLCKKCHRKYTPSPTTRGYPQALRRRVVLMCLEGQSFRSIARQVGVCPQTIINWINEYVARTSRAIYGLRRTDMHSPPRY
jgi:transposase-like protein